MRKALLTCAVSGLLFAVACGGGGGSNNNSGGNNNSGNTGTTTIPANAPVAECIQFLDNSYFWGSVKLADVRMGGGIGLSGTAVNVAPLYVDAGPVASTHPQVNVPFTTIQVCVPGTSNCVTIDHVAVDTGSVGLRIPSQLLSSLNLPSVDLNSTPTSTGGTSQGSEFAGSVPIMVMGDPSIPSAPSSCSTVTSISGTQKAGTEEDTVAELGAKGLIGVGNYQYDCDVPGISTGVGSGTYGTGSNNACSPTAPNTTPIAGTYYACSSSSCESTLVSGPQQIQNPVALFADDNGVILQLPSVNAGVGLASIPAGSGGSLVFGIGTQNGALNNNGLGGATVLPIDTNYNDNAWLGITTKFNNNYYPPLGTFNPNNPNAYSGYGSFFDSGSNGIYFLDTPISGITDCASGSTASDYFYCPTGSDVITPTPTNTAVSGGEPTGTAVAAPLTISNANTLLGTGNTAFSDLGGPNTPGTRYIDQTADEYFDWGLPFFYGKSVYTAIWGVTPPSGVPAGPFWAY